MIGKRANADFQLILKIFNSDSLTFMWSIVPLPKAVSGIRSIKIYRVLHQICMYCNEVIFIRKEGKICVCGDDMGSGSRLTISSSLY